MLMRLSKIQVFNHVFFVFILISMKNLDESEDEIKKNSPKKRAGYDKDEDFDASDAKNDAEFAPEPKG